MQTCHAGISNMIDTSLLKLGVSIIWRKQKNERVWMVLFSLRIHLVHSKLVYISTRTVPTTICPISKQGKTSSKKLVAACSLSRSLLGSKLRAQFPPCQLFPNRLLTESLPMCSFNNLISGFISLPLHLTLQQPSFDKKRIFR